MSLRDERVLFTRLLGQFIDHAFTLPGVELAIDQVMRPDGHGHMPNSLHYIGLAADLNLYVSGAYVTGAHPMWDALGAYWKSLNPICRWGGDFKAKDYNHVSLEHGGSA